MLKILLTAFDPFGNEILNSSMEAVKHVFHNDVLIQKLYLKTTYEQSPNHVIEAIEDNMPDVILMIGQAGGRMGISFERFALNIDDSTLCDNLDVIKDGTPIIIDAPLAYKSTLPLKKLRKILHDHGIPSNISNHAGTFVCNHLFYTVNHYIYQHQLPIKSGFIHVPYIHEQVLNKPHTFSMSTEEIANALTLLIHHLKA